MIRKYFLVIVFCLFCTSVINGATIFSDDFSDTLASKLNWIALSQNTTISFQGGCATINNRDSNYTAFMIHNFNVKPSTFTFSAKFTITDPLVNGAGIMYCLNSTGGVKGYTLQLGISQYLYVYKYDATSSVITNKSSSSVNSQTNVIKISKKQDLFNVFCNDKYVIKFNDNSFSSGDIAIIVPPKSIVKVDDVIVTDQFEEAQMPTCFVDSFNTTDLSGWNLGLIQGEATVGGGALVLNNTDTTFSSIIYNDEGDYSKASMRAVVKGNQGTGMYGLAFVYNSSNGIKTFAFVVNSERRYSIIHPDSSSVTPRNPQSYIKGSLGKDTLEVIRYSNRLAFIINGNDVGETIPYPANFRIDGAGIYVGKKTSATYNYFIVGGDSTGAKCVASSVNNNFIYTKMPMKNTFKDIKDFTIYDLLGRKIGNYKTLSNKGVNFNKGLYIISYKDLTGNEIRRVKFIELGR